jgi:hypothetical protein
MLRLNLFQKPSMPSGAVELQVCIRRRDRLPALAPLACRRDDSFRGCGELLAKLQRRWRARATPRAPSSLRRAHFHDICACRGGVRLWRRLPRVCACASSLMLCAVVRRRWAAAVDAEASTAASSPRPRNTLLSR